VRLFFQKSIYLSIYLGSFATAEEAALFVARTPEGQEAAKRAAAAAMSGGSCKKL